ncbi:MAG: type I 3-dehydroquinate dehydratase [Acidobacteriota bacterium]|nr:type I 3-dehydroquinate dehydratase [Acidobacteriota bacterium]
MICASLGRLSPGRCRKLLRTIPFAEIRLDLADWTEEDIRGVFALPNRLIATCRPGRGVSDAVRFGILAAALEAGAAYVDVECDAAPSFRRNLVSHARRRGRRVILSYHNHRRTPSAAVLERIAVRGLKNDADIVKIACRARSAGEALRIVSLYREPGGRAGKILAFGLGARATWTRIAAPLLGAPFTFAHPDGLEKTAEGQIAYGEMERILRLFSEEAP